QEQRRETMQQIAETGERDLDPLFGPPRDNALGQRTPERRRLQFLLGKVDLAPADVLVRIHRELLEYRGERALKDFAVREVEASLRSVAVDLIDAADADGELGLGVVVDLHLAHVG